jgi:hypothetical protein
MASGAEDVVAMIVKSLTKDPASESMPKDCTDSVIGSLTIIRGITG